LSMATAGVKQVDTDPQESDDSFHGFSSEDEKDPDFDDKDEEEEDGQDSDGEAEEEEEEAEAEQPSQATARAKRIINGRAAKSLSAPPSLARSASKRKKVAVEEADSDDAQDGSGDEEEEERRKSAKMADSPVLRKARAALIASACYRELKPQMDAKLFRNGLNFGDEHLKTAEVARFMKTYGFDGAKQRTLGLKHLVGEDKSVLGDKKLLSLSRPSSTTRSSTSARTIQSSSRPRSSA
jgi:hypothetical protein